MKDYYSMAHMCHDWSFVEYIIQDGVKMVYQQFSDWTKRKAEYESGKWINI